MGALTKLFNCSSIVISFDGKNSSNLWNLNKILGKDVYKVKEVLKDNTEEIAIVLDDIVNNIIPLHILQRNKDVFMEHIKDETIFLGIEDKNDTTSYINNFYWKSKNSSVSKSWRK